MRYILHILLLLSVGSLAKEISQEDEKEELPIYDKLNLFETFNGGRNFMINSTQKSYAYFDSFDKNAIFWISKNYEDFTSHKDERITGKFYPIEPNTIYYVRNHLWNAPSVVKRYLYPMNLTGYEIIINDDIEEINFLYLEVNQTYKLNFEGSKMKKMIKLSHKTLDSKVKIIIDEEEYELNEKEHYYKIKEDFNKTIKLEIYDNNAFIEFLTDTGEYQIFNDINYEKNEVNNDTLIINIPKTQKNFRLYLSSDDLFHYSLSYGFSNISNYYYYSKNNVLINSYYPQRSNNILIELVGAFQNINLSQNEFLSFAIILYRNPNHKIYMQYYQTSVFDNIYDEEMSEENCTKIIDNLKNVLEIYVYLDLAQNPPPVNGDPNYHHKPINLKAELDKVSKVNRKFYEFYQDIEKIIKSTKDLHFNIKAHQTPKGIPFGQYEVYLPFDFDIRKDDKNNYRIFIKKNKFFVNISKAEQNYLESHWDIPLKAINDIDPFDYIQNWSIYRQTKNPHAQFTYIFDQLSNFTLRDYPVEYSELFNEYEFDDNTSIKLWNLNNLNNTSENDEEFNDYFIKVFQKQKSPLEMPSFNVLKEEFLISKGLKQRKTLLKQEKIQWDIFYDEIEDGRYFYLKCRVDEANKVNVLVQNSFSLDFDKAAPKALDCARKFLSNEYPLIIIEDHNTGGSGNIQTLMNQIIQIRTVQRTYESQRISDIAKQYFSKENFNFLEMETCKIGTSFDDLTEISDHYNYNNIDIEHKRSKVINKLSRDLKDGINNFREEYFNSTNAKKPTDIIIFTDALSYSATSGFIRSFQDTGGAILVGYFGNPTKNGTEFFDASQSNSEVLELKNSEMYKNLNDLGFTITGVTIGEYYNDFYQKPNPIPYEYTLKSVDYRVDIYTKYSDDLYDKFIKEGLDIHQLFNNGSYCNYKN